MGVSALCATMIAAYSCSGEQKEAASEAPQAEAAAWVDTVAYLSTNGTLVSMDVKGYNAQGAVVNVDTYDVDKDGKETLSESMIYQNGKPSYGNSYNEKGEVIGHDIFTYNDKGAVKKEVISDFQETRKKIEDKTMYEYTYNEAGDVTSIKESQYVNLKWVTSYEWTYTYDDQGRVSQRVDYATNNGDRRQSCWYVYAYNDNSQLEKLDYSFYDLKINKLKHDSKTLYEYNDKGQVKQALVIRHKSNAKRDDINSRRILYSYNEASQLISRFEQKWNNHEKSWYEVGNYTVAYDEQGCLSRASTVTRTNKGIKVHTEEIRKGANSKTAAAPAAPAASVKPVISLEDKHLTAPEDEN